MATTNPQLMQYEPAQQEQYTDLVLECRGTKFPVHRVIVYPQVPAIKASCEGGFKETSTRAYSFVSVEPSTVGLLVEYLYTGNYSKKTEERDNGDYFDIQPLRDLVHVKVNEVLTTPWSPARFVDVIDVAFQVNDETLHNLMVTTVLNHLDDFIHPDRPSELFSDELCYRVLKSLEDDLKVAREKVQGLALELQKA
ncbi:hypothetical protein BO86DRAFT_404190 [Aspergillus japonicus CBS 114.51]|uniref:BTB domain-containing protein n=2 Tax=Aspergillus TaxID=5052 RepID=A0A2V5GS87_ASPV1|nr:hypothetical protein BO86DRAFT_404190 [Aspergillus japonicus CBS 114.51]PYI13641.1 hypothetical protein BO99DRAFT_438078 [Aspergillus violaceofuscus CBS 115571]RAH76951.1 hypothetical protein BO86DRAFT_404190 [Aspergillus japonicus CBS 114.51]